MKQSAGSSMALAALATLVCLYLSTSASSAPTSQISTPAENGLRFPVRRIDKRQSGNGRMLFDMNAANKAVEAPIIDIFTGIDFSYTLEVAVGTPPRKFLAILDTGSSDFWLGADGSYGLPATFNPAKSSTYKPINKTLTIQYATGQFSGKTGQDVVTVAGLTIDNATISAGVLTQADGLPNTNSYDGIIGFAPGLASRVNENTFFEQLILQGKIASPIFSLYLPSGYDVSNPTVGDDPHGEVCLGCHNSAKYVGEPEWYPVIDDGFYRWKFAMDGFTVDGKLIPGTGGEAVPDSGTSLLGVPSDFISAIAQATSAQVDSSNNTYIPCSQFPSFGVQFGGKNHVLNLDDLVVHIVDAANISWCQTAFTDLEVKDGNNSVILLGDTFMKNYYTIFDYTDTYGQGNNLGRLGFAPVANLPNKTIETIIKERQASGFVIAS